MKRRSDNPKQTRRFSAQTAFLVAVVVGGCLVFSYIFWTDRGSGDDKHASQLQLNQIPFNGTRAYGYLKQLCDIGVLREVKSGRETIFVHPNFECPTVCVECRNFLAWRARLLRSSRPG